MTRRNTILSLALAVIFVSALQWIYSDHILFKGQAIKQFHSYAISHSLSQSGNIGDTWLPCRDSVTGKIPQPWAEEPPLFHLWSAAWFRSGVESPAFPVWLGSTLFLVLCASWVSAWATGLGAGAFFLVLVSSPAFMRYFSQHLPDLFATFVLVAAWRALVLEKTKMALFLTVISASIKVLTLFPLAALWAGYLWLPWNSKKIPTQFLRWLGVMVLAALPFVLWVEFLKARGIPNPFVFASMGANRHSGAWSLLWNPNYWARFVTWVFIKGAGLVISFFVVSRALRLWREKITVSVEEQLLWFWVLSIIPYWILIRSGNFIHDYYFLPFFFPLALLGSWEWSRILNPGWRGAMALVILVLAFAQPLSMDRHRKPGEEAPSFCGQEVGLPLDFDSTRLSPR